MDNQKKEETKEQHDTNLDFEKSSQKVKAQVRLAIITARFLGIADPQVEKLLTSKIPLPLTVEKLEKQLHNRSIFQIQINAAQWPLRDNMKLSIPLILKLYSYELAYILHSIRFPSHLFSFLLMLPPK